MTPITIPTTAIIVIGLASAFGILIISILIALPGTFPDEE